VLDCVDIFLGLKTVLDDDATGELDRSRLPDGGCALFGCLIERHVMKPR